MVYKYTDERSSFLRIFAEGLLQIGGTDNLLPDGFGWNFVADLPLDLWSHLSSCVFRNWWFRRRSKMLWCRQTVFWTTISSAASRIISFWWHGYHFSNSETNSSRFQSYLTRPNKHIKTRNESKLQLYYSIKCQVDEFDCDMTVFWKLIYYYHYYWIQAKARRYGLCGPIQRLLFLSLAHWVAEAKQSNTRQGRVNGFKTRNQIYFVYNGREREREFSFPDWDQIDILLTERPRKESSWRSQNSSWWSHFLHKLPHWSLSLWMLNFDALVGTAVFSLESTAGDRIIWDVLGDIILGTYIVWNIGGIQLAQFLCIKDRRRRWQRIRICDRILFQRLRLSLL